jgi:hypothetical protein
MLSVCLRAYGLITDNENAALGIPIRLQKARRNAEQRAPEDIKNWGGKEIIKWKCEPYRHK